MDSHVTWPQVIFAAITLAGNVLIYFKTREVKDDSKKIKDKIDDNTKVTEESHAKIQEVSKAVNGRMEQLLSAYRDLAAKGASVIAYEENERLVRAKEIIAQRDEKLLQIKRLSEGCNGDCRVLVVEDDKNDVELMNREFSKLGFGVTFAKNSNEAIGLLMTKRFDAIFVDLVIPGGMDGYDLISLLYGTQPKTPIYVVTGLVRPVIEESLKIRGATGVIEKPLKADSLMALFNKGINAEI